MHHSVGAMDVVVLLALALAIGFVVAWSLSAALRSRIERPKYRFQQNLQNYDEAVLPHGKGRE
jgi:hypothetical protein